MMTPVAAWFTYSLVVGVLVCLSAWVGEGALRAGGRAGRWAWAGGMAVTVLLPLVAVLGSMEWARSVPQAPAAVIPLAPLAVSVQATGPGPSLDGLLLWGWAILALGGLGSLVWMYRKVDRVGAAGRASKVDGVGVLVTKRLGPAVFGLRRARILVPEWTLGMDVRLRRLMLVHEGEHARAGDGQLVLGALVLAVLVPWNLPLWYQLKRLRSAIELDCDERVLRRVPDRSSYGGLLLEVGRHRSVPLLGVALAERMTLLEQRLRRISAVAWRPNIRRALWLGGVASLLLVVAMCTRDPMAPAQPSPAAAVPSQDVADLVERPVFTPFTKAPRLTNSEEVAQALEQAYPKALREAGIEGQARVWFLIDETGAVRETRIEESTGYPALDEAAESVGRQMQFTPAINRDKAVPVWVQIPIRFNTGDASAVSRDDALNQEVVDPELNSRLKEALDLDVEAGSRGAQDPTRVEKGPVFTPFTQAPRLTNQAETAQTLEQNYPPLLRDAGVGGSVVVWFLIDEEGRVRKAQVNESSGYPALDEAALRVASDMRFTPALNREKPVMVWVSIPISFATK